MIRNLLFPPKPRLRLRPGLPFARLGRRLRSAAAGKAASPIGRRTTPSSRNRRIQPACSATCPGDRESAARGESGRRRRQRVVANFSPRAGRDCGRATPSLRHDPRAIPQTINPGRTSLISRGRLFRQSEPALTSKPRSTASSKSTISSPGPSSGVPEAIALVPRRARLDVGKMRVRIDESLLLGADAC